jgi:squalene-hopene/tetraprenyl-beta-curcumene cyclase
VAILALVRADTGREDVKQALQHAQKFLIAIQNVERAGFMTSDRDYGSIGYGGSRRGDLSNTQIALEGLRLTGLDPQDEVFAKALVFLHRLQNVPGSWRGSMTMDGKKYEVSSGTDGGAAYYPGNSFAGYDETSEGKLVPRSYGSMTYALLKCYVLCGVPKDDPRLQAALNWCFENYSLDVNPGCKPELGEAAQYQGLYYYYLTLARALSLAEVTEIKGKDWRKDLRAKLQAEQRDDGSWLNTRNPRWFEDNPVICTAYALIALAE